MLAHAPDPVIVGGTLAVPIDIESVSAMVVCDAAIAAATVTATMTFRLGDSAGRPLFDLRQTIASASLDGVAIAVADLAEVTLNGDNQARMRRIDRHLAAGSQHSLALTYQMGQPASSGSQPLGWQSSPAGLTWDFWFSDLAPGRYLEMWLPANLVYDAFDLDIELRLDGAGTPHTLISNAATTTLGPHHWQLSWPAARAFSPLLHLTPSSTLQSSTASVTLPGIGAMSLELHRHTNASLSMAALQSAVEGHLQDFAQNVGAYQHGSGFTALLWTGTNRAMEYAGGTTTTAGFLRHETFHSWFARGVMPARGCDGWLDEAWTTYLADDGGTSVQPFSAGEPPVTLRYADPWRRDTPGAAYASGSRFFAGLADELGAATLRQHMRDFYSANRGRPVTTEQLAAHVIAVSGRLDLLDAFGRYVYGHGDVAATPDLYLRDNPSDTDTVPTSGVFWRSPDVWVRNAPDGGTTHQDPEHGRDNWLHARVRNRSSATARLFAVSFAVKAWAGTQFVHPGDWGPFVAVAVDTGLAGGDTRLLAARWPAGAIPPIGTHGCVLAQAYTPDDPASLGSHVWEHNNLAQRNVIVVDLVPGDTVALAARFGSSYARLGGANRLELRRLSGAGHLTVELAHPDSEVLLTAIGRHPLIDPALIDPRPVRQPGITLIDPARIDLLGPSGRRMHLLAAEGTTVGTSTALLAPTGLQPTVHVNRGFATVAFGSGPVATMPLHLRGRRPLHAQLWISAPSEARPGTTHELDLVQRDASGAAVGGIGVVVHIVTRRR